jgi:beta-N-acetylhexosaminidase
VVVADALDMAAITDNFSVEDVVKNTINAGVDLLLLPGVKDTKLFELTQIYLDTAVAQVKAGEIDEAKINEAVMRILRLKQKYGLLDQKDFGVTEEKITAAKNGVGSAAHKEIEWQIAEKALTLVKNENKAFPIELKAGDKTLILFADSCASRAGTGELARKLLEEKQALPEGAEILVMKNTRENEKTCIEAACSADHVILVHRVYAAACLDPETEDGFSSGTFDRLIDAVHGKGKTVIVVSCQLPYDAGRFPKADAILLTYWGVLVPALSAENSAWSANLPAGLLSCFGQGSAEGRLPVNIPVLDEQYRMTDKVLYPRAEYNLSKNTN